MKKTAQKLQNLKGFRDFLPADKLVRDQITAIISQTFEQFGFAPVETPTLEYASLLLGKYGDEADKLVYSFQDRGGRQVALRYDQTVPTARLLAQYQSELPRYFRRYQIQNVFRADKPQKGRFREFTQCDIDIFGSTSPLADAEIVACTYASFKAIGFEDINLLLNDRQVLIEALQPFATDQVDVLSIIQTIDKLDKMSEIDVQAELVDKGLSANQASQALSAIQAAKPSENLRQIMTAAEELGVPNQSLIFTPTLARGLDYYTGMIFEVQLPQYPVGSCGGGGRYDTLIEELSGTAVPAVGIAFGFDRVVEAALELELINPKTAPAQVLVGQFGPETQAETLAAAAELRAAGLRTELYPAFDKLGKQFSTADQKNIPFVALVGPEEAAAKKVAVKNLASGDQTVVSLNKAIKMIAAATFE